MQLSIGNIKRLALLVVLITIYPLSHALVPVDQTPPELSQAELSQAEQSTSKQAEPKQTEPKHSELEQPEPDEPTKKPKPRTHSGTFNPSEKISEDYSVPFPVDI